MLTLRNHWGIHLQIYNSIYFSYSRFPPAVRKTCEKERERERERKRENQIIQPLKNKTNGETETGYTYRPGVLC